MFITIINDSRDDNAMARQRVRAGALMEAPVTSVGVVNDLEAAGNLVDVLDASEGAYGVVLVNVAPRDHGAKKKWKNGTPFGYFEYKDTLVVSSVDGATLSLVKKLGLMKSFRLFDIPTVLPRAVKLGIFPEELVESVVNTQFRSYEFVPRVAKWVLEQQDLPYEDYDIAKVQSPGSAVWMTDSFGNCKTTLTAEDIDFAPGRRIRVNSQEIMCYERLKDVDDDALGVTIGSSGIEGARFIEIAKQGGSAADELGLQAGSKIDL